MQWIIFAASAIFYTLETIWASLMIFNRHESEKLAMDKIFILDAVNKILPALLLIITIMIFKGQINKLSARSFFAREKLMLVHTLLFCVFIVAYIAMLFLQYDY